MSDLIKIAREPNPSCILQDNLDTPVWRYMDLDKFQSLLKEKEKDRYTMTGKSEAISKLKEQKSER